MRVLLAFFAILSFGFSSLSQTFVGTGGNIPNLAITQTCFNATVTGVGATSSTNGLVSVCINISHNDVGDLEIVLKGPDGTVIPLTMQNGGAGNNFNVTCFTATATTPIKSGTAPFNGSYLPEGHLGALNNGQNANGTWSLCILDRRNNSGTGTVNSWSLTFGNNPAPIPPALPGCVNTLPSTSSCATATIVCDFNGQCGSTAGSSVQTWPALTAASCFSLQNNSFIKFIAASATASFSVWIPTTIRPNYLDGGLQMLFFSGTCNGPVTTYGCYEHIYPNSGTGQPTISVITASGLTPGNTYYLMIDGYNGDNCTFTIAANTGVNVLNITPPAPAICEGASVNLTATGGNGVYSWSPASYLNTTAGTTVTATPPLGTQTYTVSSTTATGCPLTKDVTVTVTPLPVAPTATVSTQPTCSTPTGTITITAPIGAGLQYSISGGPYQASPIFPLLIPGSYTLTVQNAAGCTSAPSAALLVNAVPVGPAAATGTVTQPICSFPFGIFIVSTPVGAQYEYSVNGITYQTSTVFGNLPVGTTYNATVRDLVTGCVSPIFTFTINPTPVPPAAPAATLTLAPNCGATGTITVTSPLGADFEYSLNNGPFQGSPIFTGVTGVPSPAEIRVRSISGNCTSAVTLVPVTASPAPTTFLINSQSCVLQSGGPTPTPGRITFLSPLGANYEYSIDGGVTYQSSPVFNNLAWATYSVTYRMVSTVCVAPTQTVTLSGIPGPVTYNVTQPATCLGSGTITVTAPLGSQYSYELLVPVGSPGTTIPWQASPVFNNVSPGTYMLVVGRGQCLLNSTTAITITAPFTQAGPSNVTAVHPNCGFTTGSIILTPPAGSNLEYSINGTTYQASTTFNNVPPGNYFVTVRNTITGCVSTGVPVTVNPPPTLPTTPTGSVTTLPDCQNSGGTITITSPVGAIYEYSSNGGTTYQSSPVFTNLASITHSIIVRNTSSGCLSQPLILAVPAGPIRPNDPTVSTIQPDCNGSLGIINVTAPLGAGLQYNINGGAYQSSTTFSNLTEALYLIKVKDATGCESFATPAIILQSAGIPAKPVIVQQQPGCPQLTGTITVTLPVGGNIEYSLNGTTYQSSNIFTNVAGGNYLVTARFRGTSCVSASTSAVIKGLTPADCIAPANGDLFFPSAFTPNSDLINDGFGPGPRSNLSAVTNYTLMVFNRYGELVFKSIDPLLQWDGKHKGKMLANNSYTWVASYKFGTRPQQMQKGTVTIIR